MRRALTIFPLLACAAQWALGEDAKHLSYHSSAKAPQSQEEVEDIGEIAGSDDKSAPPPAPETPSNFRFNATGRAEYTTNAKLTGSHSSSDLLLLPSLEAGYNSPFAKNFSFDLALRVDSVIYGQYDERGFIGYSTIATVDYRPRPSLPRIYIRAEPYRFDSFDTGDLITQALGLSVGTDWGYAFNANRSLVYLNYSFTDYLSDPNIDDRIAHKASVGLAHQFSNRLTGQFYYAYQYSNFQDIDRHDSRHIVGANLVYRFSDHLFGSLSSAFVDNDATQNRASYQSFVTSVGLSLQF